MPIRFTGFDWDDGNRGKCAKHGVSMAEVEGVFGGAPSVFPDMAHSGEERRFLAIGRGAAGRHILVVFTIRGVDEDSLIRPISARYTHRKEAAYYESHTQL